MRTILILATFACLSACAALPAKLDPIPDTSGTVINTGPVATSAHVQPDGTIVLSAPTR